MDKFIDGILNDIYKSFSNGTSCYSRAAKFLKDKDEATYTKLISILSCIDTTLDYTTTEDGQPCVMFKYVKGLNIQPLADVITQRTGKSVSVEGSKSKQEFEEEQAKFVRSSEISVYKAFVDIYNSDQEEVVVKLIHREEHNLFMNLASFIGLNPVEAHSSSEFIYKVQTSEVKEEFRLMFMLFNELYYFYLQGLREVFSDALNEAEATDDELLQEMIAYIKGVKLNTFKEQIMWKISRSTNDYDPMSALKKLSGLKQG